jgi:hypothetical protein
MAKLETHVTKEMLDAFHKNQLSDDDYMQVLEHTAKCTYCASLFAASFDQDRIIKAPPGLKESILTKANKRTIPSPSLPWKNSKRRQMFIYSLKVCAAMCGALLIMISSMRIDLQEVNFDQQSKTTEFHFWDDLNDSMKSFSDGINEKMNSIVTIYDNNNESSKEQDDSNKKSEVK